MILFIITGDPTRFARGLEVRFCSGCILLLGYIMPDLSDPLLTLRLFLISSLL